jgi:hypothetical protein
MEIASLSCPIHSYIRNGKPGEEFILPHQLRLAVREAERVRTEKNKQIEYSKKRGESKMFFKEIRTLRKSWHTWEFQATMRRETDME